VYRVFVASLLVACGGHAGPAAPTGTAATAATTLRDGPPLATPGERMQYRLSLRGVDLATYDLGVGEVTDVGGKPAITVVGHARTHGLAAFVATIDDQFTSWVGVADGLPVRYQTDEYASGSKSDIEHAIVDLAGRSGDTITVAYHLNDAAPRLESQKVSQPVVWDLNAVMLALRTWAAPAGTQLGLEVFRSRYLWHVDVTMRGKDKVVTALGELPALRIEGRTYKLNRAGARDPGSEERTFTMWISDDDGRVPLEIKATTDYGALRMQIVDYNPGTGQRLRDPR
jgi:hypothetical protein